MKGLDPVRARRLQVARDHARQAVDGAREESSRLRIATASEAQNLIREAQREGEASAEVDTGREWTAARRQARAIVLAGQKAAYDELIAAATEAVTNDPRYARLLQRITDDARRQLGPGAEVHTEDGAVIASRRQRQVTWSPADAVRRAMASGVIDIEELWR